MRIRLVIAAVVAATLFVKPAQAAITINIYETGGDVVFSYSGSLDLTGMNPINSFPQTLSGVTTDLQIYFADTENPDVDFYSPQTLTGPPAIGPNNVSTAADSVSGDGFAMQITPFSNGGEFAVPAGYLSGDYIEGEMTFESADFATLGIDTASAPYVWTLTNTAADTITLQVIPEPTSALFLGYTGALACLRRRRR